MSLFIQFESWHRPSRKIQRKLEEKFRLCQVLKYFIFYELIAGRLKRLHPKEIHVSRKIVRFLIINMCEKSRIMY